jgi:hypothetical protein
MKFRTGRIYCRMKCDFYFKVRGFFCSLLHTLCNLPGAVEMSSVKSKNTMVLKIIG